METTLDPGIRDIVLCGHGSAGKTSLIDRLLEKTHEVKGHHSVDDGTSICDFEPEEKEHHYSIEASLAHFKHQGLRFNCIDAPGYPDFIGQTISAMRGADTAVIVIDAHTGIAVNTRRVFHEAEKAGFGRVIVINKLDTENVDFPNLMESIRLQFGSSCIPWNIPISKDQEFHSVVNVLDDQADTSGAMIDPLIYKEALVEAVIEADEHWMERYFEGEVPTAEQITQMLPQAVADGNLIPVICCSIKTGVGTEELLDALAQCSVPPQLVHRTAKNGQGEDVELHAEPDGPLAAQVFQTRIDPFVQKLSYIRVYSGTLRKDDTVDLGNGRKGVKIGQLLDVQANQLKPVNEAKPGDIVAVAKVDELYTGTNEGEVRLPEIDFPEPMVGLAIRPKSRNDETKLSVALHKLVEEDPTIRIDHDAQTHEIVLRGMSDLHLNLIQERIARRDHVEIETHDPKIPYRETILTESSGTYRHRKQSGGRGQFGEVHIRLFPLPRDTDIAEYATKANFHSMKRFHYHEDFNFLFVNSVVGGVIPGNFMPAVEKGLIERMQKGVLAGHQIQDICVEVHYGKHHPVDSSETAFKIAASMALK
ncbi:MAG: elongation factor G, partial [Pirellulales bacterium]